MTAAAITERPATICACSTSPPTARVYLAGPITGLDQRTARFGWRRTFAQIVPAHVHCYSPMRADPERAGVVTAGERRDHPQVTDSGIVGRDLNDVRNADIIVCGYFDSRGAISLGTAMELGFAHAMGKLVVAAGDPGDPNIDHPFTRRVASFIVPTVREAAEITTLLTTPGI